MVSGEVNVMVGVVTFFQTLGCLIYSSRLREVPFDDNSIPAFSYELKFDK